MDVMAWAQGSELWIATGQYNLSGESLFPLGKLEPSTSRWMTNSHAPSILSILLAVPFCQQRLKIAFDAARTGKDLEPAQCLTNQQPTRLTVQTLEFTSVALIPSCMDSP